MKNWPNRFSAPVWVMRIANGSLRTMVPVFLFFCFLLFLVVCCLLSFVWDCWKVCTEYRSTDKATRVVHVSQWTRKAVWQRRDRVADRGRKVKVTDSVFECWVCVSVVPCCLPACWQPTVVRILRLELATRVQPVDSRLAASTHTHTTNREFVVMQLMQLHN